MQITTSDNQDTTQILQKHKQNYETYINKASQSIKEKEIILKKSNYSQLPASLPKLHPKQFLLEYLEFNQSQKGKKTSQSTRCKLFKNFIYQLDEQHKKASTDNMNLLGLQVKKIGLSEKNTKSTVKVVQVGIDFAQSTIQIPQNITFAHLSRIKNQNNTLQFNENRTDLVIRKLQCQSRQSQSLIKKRTISSSKNSFRFKDRPQLSKANRSQSKNNSQIKPKKLTTKTNLQYLNPIYEGRFSSYRQLLFKINYAHHVFVDFIKNDYEENPLSFKNQQKLKAFIGQGNNCVLIKNLIRRRFWWTITEEKSLDVNFIWTQLKFNQYFKKQQASPIQNFGKLSKDDVKTIAQPKLSPTRRIINRKKPLKLSDYKFYHKVFTQDEGEEYHQKMFKYEKKSFYEKMDILNLKQVVNFNCKVHNHLINNFYLGNKKALFYNLKQYYTLLGKNPFMKIPLTFHIKQGIKDNQYKRFVSYYKKRQAVMKNQEKQQEKGQSVKRKMRNVWIVKPGELTNRGNGITVIDEIYELNSIIRAEAKHDNGIEKTFIVQLYIDRPLLYQKRKFDIRHYMLITNLYGIMRGYWFTQGYIRTCSYEFNIDNFDREIHLTNDAVQKYTANYGRYEIGNKISYSEFQRYLQSTYPKKKYNFYQTILPQMKQICIDAIRSSYLKISPQRLKHNFEIFGMDFMIDSEFKPWLIQINTNPCLELSSPLLARIIPQMVDQALRLSLDVIYPPPCHYPNTAKHLVPQSGLQSLHFELIFDQKRDGADVRALYKGAKGDLLNQIGEISEDETYEDDGKEIVLDDIL